MQKKIKLRHSDTGRVISVTVWVDGKELPKDHPDHIAAVKKVRDYGSVISTPD